MADLSHPPVEFAVLWWGEGPAPDRLWLADLTSVPNRSGCVYVSFVVDAYWRWVLGWQA